ncbi:MAG: DNA primase small subunit domain-containing protein [Candidatus Nanohaloarchaea archaeon]
MGEPREWKIRQYYQQEELKEHIMEVAQYREVAPTYPKGYGKRPDAINFPGDFDQFVENGAVAFHASVERWRNPLLIDSVSNMDDLRKGWDLVMDIDCDHSFELAKDTALMVIEELKQYDIEEFSVKFSGNRGFHIGLRREAFPDQIGGEDFSDLYPDFARAAVDYIREELEEKMKDRVKEHGLEEEMQTDDGEDPYQVADIENDWGSRHLFRMPYSLHDGTWLVSLPIEPEEVEEFEKEDAEMDKVEFETGFLDSYQENEALAFARKVDEFMEKRQKKRAEKEMERIEKDDFERPDEAIPEKYFPPTIKNTLEGLKDGRKRALFILINFYRTVGYGWDEIESKIWEWNERNHEPLRESYVKGQLNWHRRRDEDVPPPNYDSKGYYRDIGVYEGDPLEEKVPNPVSYAFKKAKKRDTEEKDEDIMECPKCGKEYKMESYFKKHVQTCREDEKVRKLD